MRIGTTTPEQIEAEARERFPELDPKHASLTYPAEAMRSHNRSAFESGARWAALVAAAGVAPRAEYHRGYQEGLLQAGMAMQASIDAGERVAAAGVAPCSELLCPLHHDGDSSPRNRADERTDNNLVDESPDRQACNKSGNDGHDHFRSVHNAQGSNGADSPTPGVTPQEPGEPTYSTDTGQWSGSCPCIRAEQVDPECEWHGQPEFRRGGALQSNAPSREVVAKAARVLHIATCCKLSEESEHQEPQNEDLFTAGVVLNAVPVSAPVQVDEAKLADMLETHQAGFSEGGSFDGCQCGEDFEDNDGAGSGHPAHQAKMLSVTLRGGGQ